MALIAKASYFVMCEQCFPPHGTIVCTDDSQALCYSKAAARVCADELIARGLVSKDEKPGLIEQIDAAPLCEFSPAASIFKPSGAFHDTAPGQDAPEAPGARVESLAATPGA